jgi:hypothetical protein
MKMNHRALAQPLWSLRRKLSKSAQTNREDHDEEQRGEDQGPERRAVDSRTRASVLLTVDCDRGGFGLRRRDGLGRRNGFRGRHRFGWWFRRWGRDRLGRDGRLGGRQRSSLARSPSTHSFSSSRRISKALHRRRPRPTRTDAQPARHPDNLSVRAAERRSRH